METVIKLSDISKVYTTKTIETQALEGINLEVNKGEFLSIMGPSGCGKSTLLNIIGLLDRATSGDIRLFGKELSGLRDREMARFRNENLGFVFQSFHLIPTLNVIDNVMVPLTYRKGAGDRRKLAREALEKVGLSHRTTHFPAQLSGGQAQRLALARTLAHPRPVLVLDDPFSALDRSTEDAIFAELQAYARDKVVFLISHRLYHFPQMQQIIFMEGGRTTVGTHEELMAAVPVYRQLYESQTGLKGGEGA